MEAASEAKIPDILSVTWSADAASADRAAASGHRGGTGGHPDLVDEARLIAVLPVKSTFCR